ncbi:MAG: hypothetical protein NDJ89_08805 [Oligoflexia bacterium]|nr:hypothetical protein [Oligoflexia bacterium]
MLIRAEMSSGVDKAILSLRRINWCRLMQLFAAVSTIYGFVVAFNMDEYLPWRVRLIRGLELTTIAHLGLWLATFNWRGKFRFVVAALLLPSMAGMLFLWWYPGIPVQAWLGWRVFQLIRGVPRDDQSN